MDRLSVAAPRGLAALSLFLVAAAWPTSPWPTDDSGSSVNVVERCAGARRPVITNTYNIAAGCSDAQVEQAFTDCETDQKATGGIQGCEIVFPQDGTCDDLTISDITLMKFPDENLIIRGPPDKSAVLRPPIPQVDPVIWIDGGISVIEIYDLEGDGRKSEQTTLVNGNRSEFIRVHNAGDSVCIRDNYVHDFTGVSIEARSSEKVIVEYNRLEDGGCHATAAAGLDCPLVDEATNGIEVGTGYCDFVKGTPCTVTESGGTDPAPQGTCSAGQVCLGGRKVGTVGSGNLQGGGAQFSAGVTQSVMRHNTVRNHAKSGLHCVSTCSQVWIEDNVVSGVQGNGIIANDFSSAAGQQDVVIRNNTVYDSDGGYYGAGDYGKCLTVLTGDTDTARISLIDNVTWGCERHIKATGDTTDLVIQGHEGRDSACVNELQNQSAFILDGIVTATLKDNVIEAGLCESALELRNIVTSTAVDGSNHTGGSVAAVEMSGTTTGALLGNSTFSGSPIGLSIGASVVSGTLAADLSLTGTTDDCVNNSGGITDNTVGSKCTGAALGATVVAVPDTGTEPLSYSLQYTVSNPAGAYAVCLYCDCPGQPCAGTGTIATCTGLEDTLIYDSASGTVSGICQDYEEDTLNPRIEVEDGL